MATGSIVNVIIEGKRAKVVRETVAEINRQLKALQRGTGVIVNVVARIVDGDDAAKRT